MYLFFESRREYGIYDTGSIDETQSSEVLSLGRDVGRGLISKEEKEFEIRVFRPKMEMDEGISGSRIAQIRQEETFDYDSFRNTWIESSRASFDPTVCSLEEDKEFWNKYESDCKSSNDGWVDLRIGHDPHCMKSCLLDSNWMTPNWKRLLNTPWMDQKTKEWINERSKNIRGSDLHLLFALGEEFKTMDKQIAIEKAHDYLLNQKKDPGSCDLSSVPAIQHGNCYEDEAGYLHCWFWKDIGFKFGSIPHKNPNYRLAISPDLISWLFNTAIELKAPAYRDILKNTTFEKSKELKVLEMETLLFGKDPKSFTAITNLPEECVGFVDKLQAYWHQCQMQMEVIGFDTDWMFFTQYGIAPNPYYRNQNPMISFTKVNKSPTWFDESLPYFEKFWNKLDH